MAGLVVSLGLTACASAPENLLQAVATQPPPGASRVDMLVATTRRVGATDAAMFSGERGADLSFASIGVSIPPDGARKIGDVQWPSRFPGDPATDFVALSTARLSREGALSWLAHAGPARRRKHVLLFVHGFNNRFEDAVFRFAQIVHDSGAPVVPVLFTWPSRASVFAYGYDRESAAYSRDAFEAVLQALARDPDVEEVSILAHSMGNWLTLEGLRQMAIRNGHIAPKVHNVILASPDVDVDLFRSDLNDLGRPRPAITLIVSRDDRALAVSTRLWGSVARLGAVDPLQEPYRSEFASNGITVVDLSDVSAGDQLNHAKFASSPEVVRLLGTRVLAGQTITDSRVGLGDRIIEFTGDAAASAGSAAALVLSAPAAVVDPTTRSGYGSQFSRLGTALSDTAFSSTRLLPVPTLPGHAATP